MYRLEEKKDLIILLLFEEMYVLWKETKTKDLVCFTICLHLQGLHDNETWGAECRITQLKLTSVIITYYFHEKDGVLLCN